MLNCLKYKYKFNFYNIAKKYNFEQFKEKPKRHFLVTYKFFASNNENEIDIKLNNKQCKYIYLIYFKYKLNFIDNDKN